MKKYHTSSDNYSRDSGTLMNPPNKVEHQHGLKKFHIIT